MWPIDFSLLLLLLLLLQYLYARALCNLDRFEDARKCIQGLGNLDMPVYQDVVNNGSASFSVSLVPFALRMLVSELHSYLGTIVFAPAARSTAAGCDSGVPFLISVPCGSLLFAQLWIDPVSLFVPLAATSTLMVI